MSIFVENRGYIYLLDTWALKTKDVLDKEKSIDGLNKELQSNGLAYIRVGLAKPY